ncbi:hypothetical protein QL285_088428 [Trifolium repens]|nr:hypothetical protein QL285_088428 [Trifolium repens]
MDKSWITQPQTSYEYIKGLNGFLDFAFKNRLNGMAKCPCKKCGFKTPQFRNVMYDHLRVTPFPVGYTCWCYHGEVATGENNNGSPNNPLNLVHDNTNVEDPIQNMINDAFGVDRNHSNEVPIASNVDIEIDEDVMPNTTQGRTEAKEFYELAKDGEQPLYEGCTKYSKLAFLVKLYHIKCLCGMSDKAMTMILELLQDAFEHAKIPSSFYEAKKTITKLGLNYEKIPQEMRNPPKTLSGLEILEQLHDINVTFGRRPKQKESAKRTRGKEVQLWKKKSIFFGLPYWKDNCLRHNLDVMHIEKNVCDNVIFTLLNDSAKSKDNVNARRDLKRMIIRPELWPNESGKYPLAVYAMTNRGRKAFLATLKNITVPDGYASNISRCIDLDNGKLNGMLKSHDCHILMEQLLPLAMRTSLPDEVSAVLIELCSFFRQLCGKVLKVEDLDKLQNQIVLTLCHMEMLFPPSFFTVMVHLVVHLVEEAKLGGPVHYRWMYPIERYLGHLKSYVRNKARPEGSIAEGYLLEEILTFCSRYLDDIETRCNRRGRADDVPNDIQPQSQVAELFPLIGKPVGGSSYFTLTQREKLQAHRHVLTNCTVVDYYLQQYRTIVKRQMRGRNASEIGNNLDSLIGPNKDVLISLAQGPLNQARRFNAYNVNGFKFRTLARDKLLKTQNSGVFGMFGTISYSSSSDDHMRFGGVPYYGRLIDIVELFYCGFSVVMFKCEWANTTNPRGIKKDKLGFTSINFARLIHTGEHEDDEPYIKASEAQMVFYVDDEKEQGWSIPVHLRPRDLYDMGEDEIMASNETYPSQNLEELFVDDNTYIPLARVDDDNDDMLL